MSRQENESRVRKVFEEAKPRNRQIIETFIDDANPVLDKAEVLFEEMIPGMAYIDIPDAPMAGAVFECSGILAVYLALKAHDVDAHAFGNAYLAKVIEIPRTDPQIDGQEKPSPQEQFEALIAAGKASQQEAKPGEFVYDAFYGNRTEQEWGMNIISCAICHAFSKYDAMDLVPYMCVYDDVMSDKESQGLKRTGSIAVGASQCDFLYKRGGEPQRLAKLYPEKIHFSHES